MPRRAVSLLALLLAAALGGCASAEPGDEVDLSVDALWRALLFLVVGDDLGGSGADLHEYGEEQ